MIVYDCEIIKAIPDSREPRMEGIDYCDGWQDHANMGISVIVAWRSQPGREQFHIFLQDNFDAFAKLVDGAPSRGELVVGFNSFNFDDKLCQAHGIPVTTTWDLLLEIWRALGLGFRYEHGTHAGYSLDALSKLNLQESKIGNGANAPILWQQGQFGEVINYCLHDVWLTKELLDYVARHGRIRNPKKPGEYIMLPMAMFPNRYES